MAINLISQRAPHMVIGDDVVLLKSDVDAECYVRMENTSEVEVHAFFKASPLLKQCQPRANHSLEITRNPYYKNQKSRMPTGVEITVRLRPKPDQILV